MKLIKSSKIKALLIVAIVGILTLPLTANLYKKFENRNRNIAELSALYELEKELSLPDERTRRESYGCRTDAKGARHCDHRITSSGEGDVNLEPVQSYLVQAGWEKIDRDTSTDPTIGLLADDFTRFSKGSGPEKLCVTVDWPDEDSFGVYFWRVVLTGNDYGGCGE